MKVTMISMGICVSYKLKHNSYFRPTVKVCVGAATLRGNRLRKTRAWERGGEGRGTNSLFSPCPRLLTHSPRRCVRRFRLHRYIIRLSVCCQHWARRGLAVRCAGGVTGYLDAALAWRGVGSGEVAGWL